MNDPAAVTALAVRQATGAVAPAHNPALIDLLIQFTVFDEGGLVLNRMPTATERQMLQNRKSELGRALMPTRETEADSIALRLSLSMWLGGYSSLAHADNVGLVASYVSYLQEKPLWAILRAIQASKDGRLEVFDGKGATLPLSTAFAPSAQTMLDAATGYVRSYDAERDKIGNVLAARRLMRPEPTPESRARVGEMMTNLAKTITAPFDAEADRRRTEARAALTKRNKERRDAEIIAEYARLGVEPQYATEGVLVSPELLRTLNK